jgi:trimeric autotransporter adhesin
MNARILLSALATSTCLFIGTNAKAQTITAPVGTPITITNAVDITVAGGSLNVPADGSLKFGGDKIISLDNGGQNLNIGKNSGNLASTGVGNMWVGLNSGSSNSTGYQNLSFGAASGRNNTTGYLNFFLGSNAGYGNSSGYLNTFIGSQAGYFNTTGKQNICIGVSAGINSNGNENTFIGISAGENNSTGTDNIAIGYNTGRVLTTGTNNTVLGNRAELSVGTLTNATVIGANATASASNTVVLGQAATTIIGQGLSNSRTLSGLRFEGFNSGSSPTSVPGGKVLSVDGTGNVVLVTLTGGISTNGVGQPVSDNWKEADGYLYNNSTNGVVIKGTGLDGNSLIVKGGVLSKEVNVKVEGSESWPDYVFQPSYKRMSLDEVEKFITVNKHLPNVPSAAEMAITGNNLGKTDVKLLEKVEELTLYLLEMKKTNDAQSAELQSLKNQMNKLKKNRK